VGMGRKVLGGRCREAGVRKGVGEAGVGRGGLRPAYTPEEKKKGRGGRRDRKEGEL
jgi:hypothetical protein